MAENAEHPGWDLLTNNLSDRSSNPEAAAVEVDESECGAIKHDYFSLEAGRRYPPRHPDSDEPAEIEGSGGGDGSWIDPDSSASGDLGLRLFGVQAANSSSFWSDLSTSNSERGGEFGAEGMEASALESLDWIGGSNDLPPPSDRADEEVEFVSGGARNDGGDGFGRPEAGDEGEKKPVAWWNLPMELLKLCVLKAKPAWMLSIAAAVLGVVMLGRKLYRMKHKSGGIALKFSLDSKRESVFMARTVRPSEVFSVAKRVPIVRASLPAGGPAPWPVLGLALI